MLLGVIGGLVRVTLEDGPPTIYGIKCPLVETFVGEAGLRGLPDGQRIAGTVTWGDVKKLVRHRASPDESGVFLTAARRAGKKRG